jgi:hypothetical protein
MDHVASPRQNGDHTTLNSGDHQHNTLPNNSNSYNLFFVTFLCLGM